MPYMKHILLCNYTVAMPYYKDYSVTVPVLVHTCKSAIPCPSALALVHPIAWLSCTCQHPDTRAQGTHVILYNRHFA